MENNNNVTCEVGIFTGDFLHIIENFHIWNLHFYMFIWEMHIFSQSERKHGVPWNLPPYVNPTFSCATGDFHKNIMCFVSWKFSSNWLFLARGLEFAHVETWHMKFAFSNVNSMLAHWLLSFCCLNVNMWRENIFTYELDVCTSDCFLSQKCGIHARNPVVFASSHLNTRCSQTFTCNRIFSHVIGFVFVNENDHISFAWESYI